MSTKQDTERRIYPPICSFRRSNTMTIEAYFEPYLIDKLRVQIGEAVIYLDGELEQSEAGDFHRSVRLRDDLQFTRPRAVLQGDTLTIAMQIAGESFPRTSSSDQRPRQLPVIRVSKSE